MRMLKLRFIKIIIIIHTDSSLKCEGDRMIFILIIAFSVLFLNEVQTFTRFYNKEILRGI